MIIRDSTNHVHCCKRVVCNREIDEQLPGGRLEVWPKVIRQNDDDATKHGDEAGDCDHDLQLVEIVMCRTGYRFANGAAHFDVVTCLGRNAHMW